MAVNWQEIKQEYATTNVSYRFLAKKHNVSYTELSKHGREENWRAERENYLSKTYSKTIEKLANAQADRVARLQTITDKMLNKIEKSIDLIQEADLSAYRQVTAALKDIKEIQMLKSDADIREQEARIDKLRKEVEEEKKDTSINITFGDEVKKYGV